MTLAQLSALIDAENAVNAADQPAGPQVGTVADWRALAALGG